MEGHETVGVLLRFDAPHSVCKYKWSWCGNSLGYDNAALAHPVHCATVMQVVAAVVSGIKYMIQHPREGINFSEELAHSEVSTGGRLVLIQCHAYRASAWPSACLILRLLPNC